MIMSTSPASSSASKPESHLESQNEDDSNRYSRFSIWRKRLVLFIVSWSAFAVISSSTSLLTAAPEIAAEFGTTVEIINITNAAVLVVMGSSSLFWGPLTEVIGRRHAYNASILLIFLCSIAIALAPNMRVFTAMRILGGCSGTFILLAGQTILSDIFEPTVRGTAIGFFMIGTVTAPAIGPLLGGIITNFTSWRMIYWVQVAMLGLALLLSFFFVPDIQEVGKGEKHQASDEKMGYKEILKRFNPLRTFETFIYPNVLLADIACGLLTIYQYALLTSVRQIINLRFNLASPLVSGLFYIAPGTGCLVGSLLGGRISDWVVKKNIAKRGGIRLPQDRLKAGLILMFLGLPGSSLVYGWTLNAKVGGLAVPIVASFIGGMSLMGTFSGLNTYAAEVLPQKRSEVISGKYIFQYLFGAGASGAVAPLIKTIGAGWTFTICSSCVVLAGCLVLSISRWGLDMQIWVESRGAKAKSSQDTLAL